MGCDFELCMDEDCVDMKQNMDASNSTYNLQHNEVSPLKKVQ